MMFLRIEAEFDGDVSAEVVQQKALDAIQELLIAEGPMRFAISAQIQEGAWQTRSWPRT